MKLLEAARKVEDSIVETLPIMGSRTSTGFASVPTMRLNVSVKRLFSPCTLPAH